MIATGLTGSSKTQCQMSQGQQGQRQALSDSGAGSTQGFPGFAGRQNVAALCLLALQITPEQIKEAVTAVIKENEARLKEERCVTSAGAARL